MNGEHSFYCYGSEMDEIIEANAGKERRPLAGLPYFRVIDGDHGGTSLLKTFAARNKKVFTLFGCPENLEESMTMYPDGKYTLDYLLERVGTPGEFYSIYRNYGEWRIGGIQKYCPHLGELLECISSRRHKGWSKLRPERIFRHKFGLYADELSSDEEVASYYAEVARMLERRFNPNPPALRECSPPQPLANFADDDLPF